MIDVTNVWTWHLVSIAGSAIYKSSNRTHITYVPRPEPLRRRNRKCVLTGYIVCWQFFSFNCCQLLFISQILFRWKKWHFRIVHFCVICRFSSYLKPRFSNTPLLSYDFSVWYLADMTGICEWRWTLDWFSREAILARLITWRKHVDVTGFLK